MQDPGTPGPEQKARCPVRVTWVTGARGRSRRSWAFPASKASHTDSARCNCLKVKVIGVMASLANLARVVYSSRKPVPAVLACSRCSHAGSRQLNDTTFEKHYSITDLKAQWAMGRETVRKLVKDEPDVVKIRLGKKKANTTYSVPESVARRIHTRLLNAA